MMEKVAEDGADSYAVGQHCSCKNFWANELHGLTQMFMSRTRKERCFWSVVIIICLSVAASNTIDVMDEYLEKQTSTMYTIRQESKLQLPSIAICPKNADAFDGEKIIQQIQRAVPGVDNTTALAVVQFAAAGYGFAHMDEIVLSWTRHEITMLSNIFDQWRGNKSLTTIFREIFEVFGYKCENVTYQCTVESHNISCCDILEPVYVLLRGRCLRLKKLYQTNIVESNALTLSFLSMPSYFTSESRTQPQLILYVSEYSPNVSIYPRFYANEGEWTRMLFQLRRIELLPSNKQCTPNDEFDGRAACFISHWLSNVIAKPYNCTLAYLQSFEKNLPVCQPAVIVRNYFKTILSPLSNFRCLPSCNREDLVIHKYGSPLLASSKDMKYYIEASYLELQYDLYKEVVQTTLPGFISQVGGQFGLFLGVSIITVMEIIVATTKILYRKWGVIKRRKRSNGNKEQWFA